MLQRMHRIGGSIQYNYFYFMQIKMKQNNMTYVYTVSLFLLYVDFLVTIRAIFGCLYSIIISTSCRLDNRSTICQVVYTVSLFLLHVDIRLSMYSALLSIQYNYFYFMQISDSQQPLRRFIQYYFYLNAYFRRLQINYHTQMITKGLYSIIISTSCRYCTIHSDDCMSIQCHYFYLMHTSVCVQI